MAWQRRRPFWSSAEEAKTASHDFSGNVRESCYSTGSKAEDQEKSLLRDSCARARVDILIPNDIFAAGRQFNATREIARCRNSRKITPAKYGGIFDRRKLERFNENCYSRVVVAANGQCVKYVGFALFDYSRTDFIAFKSNDSRLMTDRHTSSPITDMRMAHSSFIASLIHREFSWTCSAVVLCRLSFARYIYYPLFLLHMAIPQVAFDTTLFFISL